MGEQTATTAQMAKLLGFSRQNLEKIAAAGWVKLRAPNCWPIIETFQGVLKYARDEGRRSTKSASDSRVATARAKEIELRTAQRAGELCETEEAYAVLDEIFGMLKADLFGLPAAVTRDLNVRRDIEKGVTDILNRTAAKLEARARTWQPDGEIASRPQA
jgi:hypothetical protein